MTLINLLDNACKKSSKKIALILNNNEYSYIEIEENVDKFATFLREHNVKRQDRVAVFLRNTLESVVSFYGILKAGAIEVPLNVITDTSDTISYVLKDTKANVFITHSRFLEPIFEILENSEYLKMIIVVDKKVIFKKQESYSYSDILSIETTQCEDYSNKEDLAIIAYTSGTSGFPKGVMHTHSSLIHAAKATAAVIEIMEDKCLLLLPLSHAFGIQILNSRILKDSTIVLIESVTFPIEVITAIERYSVSSVFAVPTMYKMILDAVNKNSKKYNFECVKYIRTGGEKMPPERILEIRKIFPGSVIGSGYGLTEAGPTVSVKLFYPNENIVEPKLHSVGSPKLDINIISIVNENGEQVKANEIGEITFSAPSLMKGYWEKPQETEKVLKNNWLYSGDIGKLDEEGDLYILGREKDIIKSAGELISPKEIEIIIEKHPCVEEAAVIGLNDEALGEKIKAFVVLKKEKKVKEKELIDFCSKHLAFIKIPREIEFCESLPKSALVKIKRAELRKRANEKNSSANNS